MRILSRKSFTLIEVMIFVMILSIVLVTSTSFVTKLLFNLKRNENRTMASFLVDDVKEWLNGEREANTWAAFHAMDTSAGTGTRYCLNTQIDLNHDLADLGTATFPTGNCPSFVSIQAGLPPIYKRELDLFKSPAANPTQVTATITISWQATSLDIGQTATSRIKTIYTAEF